MVKAYNGQIRWLYITEVCSSYTHRIHMDIVKSCLQYYTYRYAYNCTIIHMYMALYKIIIKQLYFLFQIVKKYILTLA
jgi:hypothetical protein